MKSIKMIFEMSLVLGNFLDDFVHWFNNIATVWGNNQLVSGLILLVVAGLFGWFFSKLLPWLWKLLIRFFNWLLTKTRRQGRDHAFEKEYLGWLINQHRYLGLLPARVVTIRWGERRTIVDLEEVYVKLSVSTQSGDENWAETYGQGDTSWRKQTRLPLSFVRIIRWCYTIIFIFVPLMIISDIIQYFTVNFIWKQTFLVKLALQYPFYFWSLATILIGLAIFGAIKLSGAFAKCA